MGLLSRVLQRNRTATILLNVVAALLLVVAPFGTATAAQPDVATTAWPTYLGGIARSGYNPLETAINATTAPNLRLSWSAQAGGTISTQPIVANGRVYWGGWDGYQRASAASGTSIGKLSWATFVGRTVDSSCNPSNAGPANTPTVATVSLNGTQRSLLFVGGGGNVDASGHPIANPTAQVLALDALTGAIVWQTPLGPAPSNFAWGSPAYYSGSVYIGISSFGDCPLTAGHLFKLDAKTGGIQNDFMTVPAGCTGVGLWGSPTIDAAAGSVYIATGNPGSCATAEPYGQSAVELRLSDLSVLGAWPVPPGQAVGDGDFGSTPTLFSATVNGTARRLVGVQNKNGVFYAFVRDNVSRGPVWYHRVSGGGDCPQCGSANISPAAWDGQQLYVGGGQAGVNGATCAGTVKALNPATGSENWQLCLKGTVIAAVTAIPGVVAFGEQGNSSADSLMLVDAATGGTLFSYPPAGDIEFYGAPTIVNGVLYAGDTANTLYAFALP